MLRDDLTLLPPDERGLLLDLELRTDFSPPPPVVRRAERLWDRLEERRPPLPPSSESRSRRLLERDVFFFLLDPRATAKARKVATKTMPAKVRKRLALRRSMRCAPVDELDDDAEVPPSARETDS